MLAAVVLVEEDLHRGHQHRVPGQDRRALTECHPARRAMPALDVAIHDVVVEQREVVHQLDRYGGRHPGRAVACRLS